MDGQSDKWLGLVVLHEGESPSVDIIAVHGLGANAAWAWVRKVGSKGTDQYKEVNWLVDKDMLPAVIPHARIMTFNYESKWHKDAPKQRRILCADQLVTTLDNKRREEGGTRYRPIIFIGHSFGGIVIEQALMSANSRGETFQYLAASTVGIVFLGTPHRGTKASKWGEWLAYTGDKLGLGTNDAILKDLREDSETLNDLLYEFTLWLSRMSVLTVCFFELHKTNYGQRVGGSWKEMVVEERSACIDGHRKIALPTDHLRINKYDGPHDYSYKNVYPIIKEMAKYATEKVQRRLKPLTIVHDNSIIPKENLGCLQSLFLTNPLDDVAAIRRSKGKRIEGSCEWLLLLEEYTSWLVGDGPQMLQLVGAPGIGKTMVASYLVEELEKRAQVTPDMIFAYYFCDNKDNKRNTTTAIIRGLLLQLLRQRPVLFKHIQGDYDQMRDQVFDNFEALWRILRKMLTDPYAGQVYFLIDALDECDKSPRGFRQPFLESLADLFSIQQGSEGIRVKLLITRRPESDISDELDHLRGLVSIDSSKINADLLKYIQVKVNELSIKKKYPSNLRKDIQHALSEKAGGTFLWVSFIVKDISETTILSKVRAKLASLPSSLSEVYSRILDKIQEEDVENARFILQWVVTARRPLTVDELAMGRALGPERWAKNTVPTTDTLDELKDGFKVCEPLVYLDDSTRTINLVHQSAKDYLLERFQGYEHLSVYRIVPDKANSCILHICLKYLSMEEFNRDAETLKMAVRGRMRRRVQSQHCFLQYAIEEWQEHALAASPAVITDFAWESDLLKLLPMLRNRWLQLVARAGDDILVKSLLAANADVNAIDSFDDTALHAAAFKGHSKIVETLLAADADVNAINSFGRTALYEAAAEGHSKIIKMLLTTDVDVNAINSFGRTALYEAAAEGHSKVIKMLLTADVDVNAINFFGRTALHKAAIEGHSEVVKTLLAADADVNATNSFGRTALHEAAAEGHSEVVKTLLTANVDVNAINSFGWTALHEATEKGHSEVVKTLLTANADVNATNNYGLTALHMATEKGHSEVVKTLLTANADVEATTIRHGETALHLATRGGHLAVVKTLLMANADVKATTRDGNTALELAAGNEAMMTVLQAAAESQQCYPPPHPPP